MVPAAILSLNHNDDRDSISNQYSQPTPNQPIRHPHPVFISMRPMDSKWKGLRVSSAFFQRIYPPEIGVHETVATVGWRVEWALEAWSNVLKFAVCDELWLYLSVAICFNCLIFSCLLVQKLCFFEFLFFFVLFLWRFWVTSKNASKPSM